MKSNRMGCQRRRKGIMVGFYAFNGASLKEEKVKIEEIDYGWGKRNAHTYIYFTTLKSSKDVKENPVPNHTTTYENNNGITSGNITVTNKAQDVPENLLSETGGPDTNKYTIGGLLLTQAGMLLLYKRKKCGKEEMASF